MRKSLIKKAVLFGATAAVLCGGCVGVSTKPSDTPAEMAESEKEMSTAPENTQTAEQLTPAETAKQFTVFASTRQLPASESAVQPLVSESAAQPPVSESSAQPPVSESAAQPPVSESSAQLPVSESSAQPPVSESSVQPPVSESSAQPPASESAEVPGQTENTGPGLGNWEGRVFTNAWSHLQITVGEDVSIYPRQNFYAAVDMKENQVWDIVAMLDDMDSQVCLYYEKPSAPVGVDEFLTEKFNELKAPEGLEYQMNGWSDVVLGGETYRKLETSVLTHKYVDFYVREANGYMIVLYTRYMPRKAEEIQGLIHAVQRA